MNLDGSDNIYFFNTDFYMASIIYAALYIHKSVGVYNLRSLSHTSLECDRKAEDTQTRTGATCKLNPLAT